VLPRLISARTFSWALGKVGERSYTRLSETELLATRRSDTVFIFGSGYSINDVSAEEWDAFSKHDTFSFNWFPHQRWVRIDYHLIREVATSEMKDGWMMTLQRYGELIRANPFYNETIFLVQGGWMATNGNRLLGRRLLPARARVFRFRNRARERYEPPSESFSRGLVHSAMTLGDCVNFAYLMGWRSIVLVGVDMYDHRYFWLDPDQPRDDIDLPRRGLTVGDPFMGAKEIVRILGAWGELLSERGVRLEVFNARSLLAESLPVHRPSR
jgi:hypothetical protein